MAERMSQEVKEKAIRGWLQGKTRDEIAIEVSNLVWFCKQHNKKLVKRTRLHRVFSSQRFGDNPENAE